VINYYTLNRLGRKEAGSDTFSTSGKQKKITDPANRRRSQESK